MQIDPRVDSWVLPHSCGDVCGRKLLPECGHECLLLCHPGKEGVVRGCVIICVAGFVIRTLSTLSSNCHGDVLL